MRVEEGSIRWRHVRQLVAAGLGIVGVTFSDGDGDVVETLTAGTGFALVSTSETTGDTFTTQANGAVARTRSNPDGSPR